LEAQVVDAADEIAYDNHDLDDGITSGLISEGDLRRIPLWEEAEKLVENKYSNLSADLKKHQLIKTLIDIDVKDVVKFSLQNLKSISSIEDIKSASYRLITFSKQMQEKRKPLRDFLLSELYHHYRVVRMSDKAKRIMKELFEVYLNKPAQLPVEIQRSIESEGLKRTICDYIASMTDNFAQNEYKRLFDPLERV